MTSVFNVGCFGFGIKGVFGGQISGILQRWDSSLVGHINKTGHVQQAGHDGRGGSPTSEKKMFSVEVLRMKLSR